MYRWSLIAGRLPGRTDNEVKNYWNTHLNKKCLLGKRKTIDSNQQQDNEENMINQKKELGPSCHSEAHGSLSLTSTTIFGLEGKKEEKEEITVIDPWMDDIGSCFNRDIIDYPIMPAGGNSTASFVFDDEPLIAYLDSFIFFEAFGCGGEEA